MAHARGKQSHKSLSHNPSTIQVLAAMGKRFSEWHEEFDNKVIYLIGFLVLAQFVFEIVPRFENWARIIEFPLRFMHMLTVLILACGLLNLICNRVLNKHLPNIK